VKIVEFGDIGGCKLQIGYRNDNYSVDNGIE